jgi:hypothetical protein
MRGGLNSDRICLVTISDRECIADELPAAAASGHLYRGWQGMTPDDPPPPAPALPAAPAPPGGASAAATPRPLHAIALLLLHAETATPAPASSFAID